MGLLISAFIATLWFASFSLSLRIEIEETSSLVIIAIFLCRTFFQTGMFVVAHDATHGNVFPGNPKWNSAIARAALFCCGGISYKVWKVNHEKHHARPSHPDDPDFHNGDLSGFVCWYLNFSKAYFPQFESLVYVSRLAFLCISISLWLNISLWTVLFFVVLPTVLSSMQLFLFGTYLPHREEYCIKSYYFPPFISFIACYNFSYHLEHHKYPNVPWYLLPGKSQLTVRKRERI